MRIVVFDYELKNEFCTGKSIENITVGIYKNQEEPLVINICGDFGLK